jgi:hypothetical protein
VTPDPRAAALRRAVLGASLTASDLLAEVDVRDEGVVLEGSALDGTGLDGRGPTALEIPWAELRLAAGEPSGAGAQSEIQRRVARWIRLRALLHAHLCAGTPDARDVGTSWVLARVRPRCLPREHPVHPGPSWPRGTVLGGALDLGFGLRGFDDDARPAPDAVGLLPSALLLAAGIDPVEADTRAARYLADMAALAADRLRRDPTAVLRPLGDADVLTLLSSHEFRAALLDGQGMRSAAIPTRTRGWLDLGRLDPAFAVTAAELTEPDERGFPRPVLITADEVTLVRPGGEIVRQSLADPAPAEPSRPAAPRLR